MSGPTKTIKPLVETRKPTRGTRGLYLDTFAKFGVVRQVGRKGFVFPHANEKLSLIPLSDPTRPY